MEDSNDASEGPRHSSSPTRTCYNSTITMKLLRMAPAPQQTSITLLVVLEPVVVASDLGVLDLQCVARCSKACSSAVQLQLH
jgi:hypothetical protein